MKKKREAKKLGLQVERVRELVLDKVAPVVGGVIADSACSSCGGVGGSGPTNG